jgi:chromosome segregation ATPase
MQMPVISERMRQLQGAHMGVDLVDYDKVVEKAVFFAIGNALVTDTVRRARELADSNRIKVAAVDGTLIALNGSISGGTTMCASRWFYIFGSPCTPSCLIGWLATLWRLLCASTLLGLVQRGSPAVLLTRACALICRSFAQRSTRWDEAAAGRCEQRRKELMRELDELPDEHRFHMENGAARRLVDEARFNLNTHAAAVETTKMTLNKQQESLKNAQQLLTEKKPQLQTAQKELRNLTEKVIPDHSW